jgi:hypothetical protein
MLSSFSNSAFGMRYYKISGGGGDPPDGWIGTEIPVHNDSILLYYDFEDGNANDKSGAGNHGTDTNSDAIAAGGTKNGSYGITGDGLTTAQSQSTQITAPTNMACVRAPGLAYSMWIYSGSASSPNTMIMETCSNGQRHHIIVSVAMLVRKTTKPPKPPDFQSSSRIRFYGLLFIFGGFGGLVVLFFHQVYR